MVLSQQEAVEAIAFLLASARGLAAEPQDYGMMRLLAAAAKLAQDTSSRADEEWQPVLEELAAQIPLHQRDRLRDPEGYLEFIDDCCRRLARELKRRGEAPESRG